MKSKQRKVVELAAELERLNELVRQRRRQLAFLERCPHKTCECRQVWRDMMEKNLAAQVGTIRRNLKTQPTKPTASKTRGRKSKKSQVL